MNNEGFLKIRAFTSDALLPVPGTTVLISIKNRDGGFDLAAVMETDDSGLTQTMSFTTPDFEESQTPGGTAPSLDVIAEAEHPLYERIRTINAQIFPNTITTQDFMLRPLSDNPFEKDQREVFNITSQDL